MSFLSSRIRKGIKCPICTLGLLCIALHVYAQHGKSIKIKEGESWWGCYSSVGKNQPYDVHSDLSFNQYKTDKSNQTSPVLVSSTGRYIWSEDPLKVNIKKGEISLESRAPLVVGQGTGHTLASAYKTVSTKYFPASGEIPGRKLFIHPQLNTWMELLNNQNQKDILAYAHEAVQNGITPGILMIDGGWQKDFGVWDFNGHFPDPKEMVDELHELGFTVMLWVAPYVTTDQKITYREDYRKGYLLKDPLKPEQPYLVHWWHGFSAAYDLSNPKARQWFLGRLKTLQDKYGIDGFKFDAGDPQHFVYPFKSYQPMTNTDYTNEYGKLGLNFTFNEYRASFKMGGKALMQRLLDKRATWGALASLIPDMLTAGLMGYSYTCADIIGGGLAGSYVHTPEEFLIGIRHLNVDIDQELFVRTAQSQALMPMMQLSIAPWRVLDKKHFDAFSEALKIHESYASLIMDLAQEASKTGEPIMRNMEYEYPHKGYSHIKNQFMLGDSILVAPVVTKDTRTRDVVLPDGIWISDGGSKIEGGKTIHIDVPLDRLPYFKRASNVNWRSEK